MAKSAAFVVANEAQIELALRKIGVDAHQLSALHARVADAVAPIYQSFVPRLTGRLAASTRGGGARTRAVILVGNETDIPYAPVITFGWPRHHIAPNRWDKPATAQAGPVALGLYADEFNRIIARQRGGP